MISRQDMKYFVDPVQLPLQNQDQSWPNKLLAFNYRNKRHDTEAKLGTIVDILEGFRFEGYQLWFVDTDGNYVYGAPMANYLTGFNPRAVAILDDNTFGMGTPIYDNNRQIQLGNTYRSDGLYIGGGTYRNNTEKITSVMKAAPWAATLMPQAGDTPEVAEKRLAVAKMKWDHRNKLAGIYREGLLRDWLEHLGTLRGQGHDVPEPMFQVGIEGTYILPTTSAELPEGIGTARREQIERLRNGAVSPAHRNNTFQQYVGVPFNTVTHLTAGNFTEVRQHTQPDVNYAVRDALRLGGSADTQIVERSRYGIVASF